MRLRPGILLLLSCLLTPAIRAEPTRGLTFEQRVEAQRAIERVYYAHQSGADRPFDEAVPRWLLERKVREALDQSAALDQIWHAALTTEALRREMDRIAAGTRFPERLLEIYAALGFDGYVVQETLVRAALADRLVRNAFASDQSIHAGARLRAGSIHDALARGRIDPQAEAENRTLVELVKRGWQGAPRGSLEAVPPAAVELEPAEFDRERALAPSEIGRVGDVLELTDSFLVQVVLSETPAGARIARYTVPKISWDAWWPAARRRLDPLAPIDAADPAAMLSWPDQAAPCVPDDSWSATAPFVDNTPARRSYHTTIWTGSLTIVWGGFSDAGYLATGGRYDPVVDLWTPTATAGAPTARTPYGSVWTGSRMIVWGGSTQTGSTNTGGRYDPVADAWLPTSTAGAPASGLVVWTGSRMIAWGGGVGGRYDPANDAWTPISSSGAPSSGAPVWTGSEMIVWDSSARNGARYDPAGDSWRPMSNLNAPTSRNFPTMTWTGGEMILWGGAGAPSGPPLNTGGRYRPATDTWLATSTANAPSIRYGHGAVWTGTRMIIWGGGYNISDGAQVDSTGGIYDPGADSWTATPLANAPTGRLHLTAVWTGMQMIVWGGDVSYDIGGFFRTTKTGGRYDPVANVWSATSEAVVPSPRYAHTSVWTGTRMIVWGGYYGMYLGSGMSYDPMIDTWRPVSTVNAPSPRSAHTAVWTGARMIVWGGGNGSQTLATGGRYDPASDTWSPTSTAGAPSARSSHTAVWTGSRMIVWGGAGASTYDTGGRYDPTADSWTAMSVAGAPSARVHHTAVWAGGRMIVWGGYGATADETGGRYDLVADTWASTSLTGAPSARFNHTAVSTGGQMIVWGGEDLVGAGDVLGTGARYDPATDAWAATSTAGAPEPREAHSAVWTGSRMIVWGGFGSIATINTGGRYDPVTDAWVPTSTTGAPTARYFHSATWAGSTMIVYGGIGSGGTSSTGGRYALGQNSDDDLDGFTDCAGDCDDGDASVYPGAPPVCDGRNNDCASPGWPSLAGTNESDNDADGYTTCSGDCNDLDGSAWATPGEAQDLHLSHDIATALTSLSWSPPASAGATSLVYDGIASTSPADFTTAASCIQSDGSATTVTVAGAPPPGGVTYYLVRAQNACPGAAGLGTLGTSSAGVPRAGRTCP